MKGELFVLKYTESRPLEDNLTGLFSCHHTTSVVVDIFRKYSEMKTDVGSQFYNLRDLKEAVKLLRNVIMYKEPINSFGGTG